MQATQLPEAPIVPTELELMVVYTPRDGKTLHVHRVCTDGDFGYTEPVP